MASTSRGAGYVARGLRLCRDWGPQYLADAWINELKWRGMTVSPRYVGEPERNGVMERPIRSLKEQCLYSHQFTSLAKAREVIAAFIHPYNTDCLIARLGYRTPIAAHAAAWAEAA